MITNIARTLWTASLAVLILTACTGKSRLGMASEEGISKVKELVRTHVDTGTNKIYRLVWAEDGDERKLDNILTTVEIDYLDPESNDYSLTISLKDGEFVADGPLKSKRNIYSYEHSTPLDLDVLTTAEVQRLVQEAHDLFLTQEDADKYELKSVGKYHLYIPPVDKRNIDLLQKRSDYKKEHSRTAIFFELNFVKKDEQPEVKGRHTWTNYYTVAFVVNQEGKVEFEP
ncbi:hypothetical protein F030043B2_17700 [Bacteroides fragilis]